MKFCTLSFLGASLFCFPPSLFFAAAQNRPAPFFPCERNEIYSAAAAAVSPTPVSYETLRKTISAGRSFHGLPRNKGHYFFYLLKNWLTDYPLPTSGQASPIHGGKKKKSKKPWERERKNFFLSQQRGKNLQHFLSPGQRQSSRDPLALSHDTRTLRHCP